MSIHDEIQEMLPAYSVGALEVDEARRAEAHLASCDKCTFVLDEYQPIASALALAVPQVQPPRDLKARTMQRALRQGPVKTAKPTVPAQPRRQRSWFAPAFAGAAILIAIVALGWTAWQTSALSRQVQLQQDLMTLVAYEQGNAQIVRGTEKAPDAVGRLYADFDSSVAALVTVNMPPLDNGRVYQVWLTEAGGHKASGGVFHLDTEGNGWILVRTPQPLSKYVLVEVTDEPASGSTTPTNTPLLQAKLTPP